MKENFLTEKEIEFGANIGIVLVSAPAAFSAPYPIIMFLLIVIAALFGGRAYQAYRCPGRLDWSKAAMVTISTFVSALLVLKLLTWSFQ